MSRIILHTASLSLALFILPFFSEAAIVHLPTVPTPTGDQIVGMNFQNPTSASLSAGPVQFGQAFVQGDLPSSKGLSAEINGIKVPTQIDVKTKYPDDSVKFGVVTVMAPVLGSNTTNPTTIAPTTKSGAALSLSSLPGYSFSVDMTLSTGKKYSFDIPSLFAQELKAGRVSLWREGPVVTEGRIDIPVTSSMRLVVDLAKYQDGSYSTDVQFNNDYVMTASGGTMNYSVVITQNGKEVASYKNLKQVQYQQWHKVFWTEGESEVNVQRDIAYLQKVGAIHQYDLSTGVELDIIKQGQWCIDDPTWMEPLFVGCIAQYMPTTGGRPDIGPTTRHNTVWLLTQNALAAEMALGQGHAAASIPWHYWDVNNGTWLNTDNYPLVWTDGRGGVGVPGDVNSRGITQQSEASGWTVDHAHQPNLSYIPYLLTGNRFFLDQLNASGSFVEMFFWPSGPEYGYARNYGEGLVLSEGNQVRGGAWAFRELVEAAWANPDGTPEKAYFTKMTENNINFLLRNYPKWQALQGEVYGLKAGSVSLGTNNGFMQPWQQDFVTTSLVLASQLGFRSVNEYLDWHTNWSAGRFLNEAKGFNPRDGVGYVVPVGSATKKEYLGSWKAIGDATVALGVSMGPTWKDAGYGPMAFAALAGIMNTTGSTEAARAYSWLLNSGIPLTERYQQLDPTFNIVPTGKVPPPPTAPTPSVLLSASARSITLGQSVVLIWTSLNTTSCSGTNFSATASNGSAVVNPTKTTTYTITCFGAGGSMDARVTVTVAAVDVPPPDTPEVPTVPKPTVSLSVSPNTIVAGKSTTLSWSSTDATSCVGSGFTASSVRGSLVLTPSRTTTYSLTCTGQGGSATAGATITVTASSTPTPLPDASLPTVGIKTSPSAIYAGSSATVSWWSTNVTRCIGNGDFNPSSPNGSITVSPNQTTTYYIGCEGPLGQTGAAATIIVLPTNSTSNSFVSGAQVRPTKTINVYRRSTGDHPDQVQCTVPSGSVGTLSESAYLLDALWWYTRFSTGCEGWVYQGDITPATSSGQSLLMNSWGKITPFEGGEPLFSQTLKQGSQGEEVLRLQKMLSAMNYFTDEITGYFGAQTAAALSAFQKDKQLEPVGILGPKTRDILNFR